MKRTNGIVPQLEKRIAELEAENAKLKQERDEARGFVEVSQDEYERILSLKRAELESGND